MSQVNENQIESPSIALRVRQDQDSLKGAMKTARIIFLIWPPKPEQSFR